MMTLGKALFFRLEIYMRLPCRTQAVLVRLSKKTDDRVLANIVLSPSFNTKLLSLSFKTTLTSYTKYPVTGQFFD